MWNPKFVSLCLLLFLTGIIVAPIQFFFPIYVEEELGKMVWHAAVLRAVPIAIGGLFALIGGGLCDKFGKKMTFLIGMTGSIVVGGVFVVKLDIIILCILCYQGIAVGLRTAGGQSYLIQSVDPKALGLATAIYFQSRNIGEAIGNAIGGELITHFDYSFVGYTTIITMSMLMFMAIWMLPTDTQNKESSDIKSEAKESMTVMLAHYQKMIRRPSILILCCIRFFTTFSWGSVSLMMPVLINRNTSLRLTGYYGTVSLFFSGISSVLTGWVCDKIGSRIPAIYIHFLILLSIVGIASSVNSTWLLFISGVLGTGTAWALSITMPRFINEFSSSEEKGRGVGITHLAWSAGFMSGQLVGGALESVNIALPFIVAAVAVMVSTVFAFVLIRWIPASD